MAYIDTKEIIKKYQPVELRTGVLVLNKKDSRFRPDFAAFETKDWIVFPWEK